MYLSEFKPETHPAIKDRKTKLKTLSILKRKTSQLVKKLFIQSLKHFVYIYSSDSIFHYTYMYIQNVYLVYQLNEDIRVVMDVYTFVAVC